MLKNILHRHRAIIVTLKSLVKQKVIALSTANFATLSRNLVNIELEINYGIINREDSSLETMLRDDQPCTARAIDYFPFLSFNVTRIICLLAVSGAFAFAVWKRETKFINKYLDSNKTV